MTEPVTPAATAPEATTAPVTTPDTAPVAPVDENDTPTPDDDAIKKLKKEAQQQRAARRAAEERLAELEAAEQTRKDAELSEAEKATKKAEAAEAKAAELEQRLTATKIEAELRTAARAANYADEADALQLANSITLDTDGRPVGVTEAVAALLASKPHYAAKPGTPRLDPSNGGRQDAAPLTPQQQTSSLWSNARGVSIWNIPTAS